MALCRRKPTAPLQTLVTASPLSTTILDIPEKVMEGSRLSQKQQHFVGIISPAWLLWDHPAYLVALAMSPAAELVALCLHTAPNSSLWPSILSTL